MADSLLKELFNNNLSPDLIPGVDNDACQSLPEFKDPILTPTIMEDLNSIFKKTEVDENTVPADDHNSYPEVVKEAPLSLDSCDTSNYNSTYAKSTASDTIDVKSEQLPHLPVTNNVEISTNDTKDLDFETKTSTLDTEEPALEAQEGNLIPFSGSCLEDLHSDQGIADPFHEEFLNFNNLFPNLIPGVDNACQLQPEIPPDFILPKEKLPLSPIIDIMEDLNSIFKKTEVDENTVPADDHNSYPEVVEEAPLMQDQTESNPPSVLSPGSVVSLDSCDTSNYNSTYDESTASDNIDMELEQLLQLLPINPEEISPIDVKDLDFKTKTSTLDAKELALETKTSTSEHTKTLPLQTSTKTVKNLKRRCTTSEEPVAKRTKSDAVKSTDKVTERRIKNNAASRICRASRKQREKELFKREEELITSNQELRSQVEQLTKQTEALRKILVQHLTGCSN